MRPADGHRQPGETPKQRRGGGRGRGGKPHKPQVTEALLSMASILQQAATSGGAKRARRAWSKELLKGGESREERKALGRCSGPLPRAGSAHTSEQAVSAVGCRSTGLRWSPLAPGRNALRNRGCAYFLFPPTHPVSSRRSFGLRSSLVQKIEGVFRRWSCGEPRRARELHKGRASARATPRTAVQFTSPASCAEGD